MDNCVLHKKLGFEKNFRSKSDLEKIFENVYK